jgi:hypothetical protein
MGAHPEHVREQLRAAFSRYRFKDERCGMCCSDAAASLLAKQLSKKPLAAFTADDALSFVRVLQCHPDTGAKFILPKLLELETPEAEVLIREKYPKLRLHFSAAEQLAVDAHLEHAWHGVLGTRDLAAILDKLALIKVLSGRIEPFLAEWLGPGPAVHPSIVELALSYWRAGVRKSQDSDLRDWLLADVAQALQRAAESGPPMGDRGMQALTLLRAYSGQ